ncbi:MAG: XTP/dITP diphosphatase [Candidatus Thermoplasmatota archaeon]|nr:XTP/dITP diphosphatase [Candidatus Thermoplasmatota archaeon]
MKDPGPIYLLTGNTGKLKEIGRWLQPLGVEVRLMERTFLEAQADSLEEVILTGMEVMEKEGDIEGPFIKDDSGLFIDALGGFPGVYSAYVQRTIGNKGILDLMGDRNDRGATFRTVIGLYQPGEGITLLRGECPGAISFEERGKQGFGYDPIFIPRGEERTFAEMSVDEKNSLSHRIRAIKGLIDYLSRCSG